MRVVRGLVHVGGLDWHEGAVLEARGQEGAARDGAVPLHGRHRQGVVEVGGEVVDVDGVRGVVTVGHGGQWDGDTARHPAGHEGSRVGGEDVAAVRLAAHVEALEDGRHSVTKLHLRRAGAGARPRRPPDRALSAGEREAGGLHDVLQSLPL